MIEELIKKFNLSSREIVLVNMLDNATKEHPVTREDIMRTFSVCDRTGRGMIEDLREKGVRVNGTSKDKGYWLIRTQKELECFLRDYLSKSNTMRRRAENMKNQGEDRQVNLFELL